MSFTLRLSNEQGQTLRAIIETARTQNTAQVKLEEFMSAVLSIQDGPDVSPDPVAVTTFEHNHGPNDYGRFVRENCGACALFGVGEFSEDGGPLEPNHAGWTRLFVQAHRPVPERYRAAFLATFTDENQSYARALAGDVARHGVTFS
jgi:hypothetical protein